MKILSLNVNGLKAFVNNERALKIEKYFDWDIICFQEIKCSHSDAVKLCDVYFPHKVLSVSSQFKNGYAGVATLVAPELESRLKYATGPEIMDDYGSGRIVVTEFDTFTLVNVYTLNSGNKESYRKEWDIRFRDFISKLPRPLVIVGDLNVVSDEFGHWNYEAARNTMPGLYDFELEGFNLLKEEQGLIDAFRFRNPETRAYSWYSYRSNSRYNNQGWRIDYTLVSKDLLPKVRSTQVLSSINASDHCPVLIDLDV